MSTQTAEAPPAEVRAGGAAWAEARADLDRALSRIMTLMTPEIGATLGRVACVKRVRAHSVASAIVVHTVVEPNTRDNRRRVFDAELAFFDRLGDAPVQFNVSGSDIDGPGSMILYERDAD